VHFGKTGTISSSCDIPPFWRCKKIWFYFEILWKKINSTILFSASSKKL